MEAVATQRKIRVPPAVAFGSRFGKYKPEEEKEVRKTEVKEDKALEQLKAAWKRFRYDPEDYEESWNCWNASKKVRGINYSARDVEKFSFALFEFQDEKYFSLKAGTFLSVLINKGKDTDYVIHTRHLNKEIDGLGLFNTKNLVVDGNAGMDVGNGMKKGSITVNGNAGAYVGAGMEGGKITLNGNASHDVGQGMEGGEIHLEGNYGNLGYGMEGGKIYHEGKLIFDDGKFNLDEGFS